MISGMKRIVRPLIIAIGLYALIGFLIIPGFGLRIANQQLEKYATVPAQLQRMQFNPFTLELSLWGLHIGETGAEQIRFQRLHGNLQIDSLWTRALHLADLELEKGHTEILFGQDGTLNLTQLFNLPPSEKKPDDEPSKPFPLRIDRLQLIEKSLHFLDRRPSEPVEFGYDSLNLELANLSTLPEDNTDMTLSASGPYGSRIDWKGQVTLQPFHSSGELKVSDSKLEVFWPYVEDLLPLALKQGNFNFSTHYTLKLADSTELLLDNAQINVSPFAINDQQGNPLIALQQLSVSDTSLDLAKQQVVIGQVRGQTLEAWAAREADGQLNWQKLFQQPARPAAKAKAEKAASPATIAAAQTAGDDVQEVKKDIVQQEKKPWQVLVKDMQVRDYHAHLTDNTTKPVTKLNVGPLNLDVSNFDSLGTSPFTIKLDTGVGEEGKLLASGDVQLQPVTAKLKVNTEDLNLRVAQGYIEPFILMEIRSGLLNSQLDINLAMADKLDLQVAGNAQVDQVHTLDTLKKRDFVRWKSVNVSGINYQHEKSLNIDKVDFNEPYARFIINENFTTNINDMLKDQGGSKSTKPAQKGSGSSSMPIHIGGINIKNGSANFADFSLQPNFATAIGQLNGKIGTIDSSKPKPASVNVEGRVDRYAPVTIKGSLNPFEPLDSLDIATSFKQVELTTLTPYSGKFAGYRIQKGRLDLDLHYQIKNGKLNAQNKVLLEGLQLGEHVDSPEAVDLPVRLAVALLKDTKGNISIELPVEGDLNNPQFSVMPIVWQTLRNLVLRAVQAPFKFIGGLVGGSDVDLSTVVFDAGSTDLDAAARKGLDTLADALKQRPELRLEVQGIASAKADGPILAEQHLEEAYKQARYAELQSRGRRLPDSVDEIEVSDRQKRALLEQIYQEVLKQAPPAEWEDLRRDDRIQKMHDAVIASWAESKVLLRTLAQERASQIKEYMVEKSGFPAERVFLLDANVGESESNGRVATQLNLGA